MISIPSLSFPSVKATLVVCGAVVGMSTYGSSYAACAGGTTNAWDAVLDAGGDLVVNGTAAMGGTDCGLEVGLDGADELVGKRYVQDSTPGQEISYRSRFYFDPNDVTIATDGSERIKFANQQQFSGGPNVGVAQMKLQGTASGSGYEIRAWARKNASGGKVRATLPIVNGPNIIEIQLTIGSGDGIYRVWINNDNENSPDFEATNLNNAAYVGVDQARLGYLGANYKPDWSDSLFFDEFVSVRSNFIGSSYP